MTAIQVESLWNGLFDSNGVPLGGGKVYTYYAGTTAPQLTWQDRLKAAVHANPVVLNATGRALVFAEGFYKFVVVDANNVAQFTYDNLAFKYLDTADLSVAASPLPTGTIICFGGSPAPTGFLLCDGALVSRATYAALFTVIGSTYGAGDGTSTFAVPDFRGRSPLGKTASGTGSILGGVFGALDFTVPLPAHYHSMGAGADLQINTSGSVSTQTGGQHRHWLNTKYNTATTHTHQAATGFISEAASPSVGNSIPLGETQDSGVHDHVVPGHTHGSGNFFGSIGQVTGGVSGNNPMTSGTANHACQVCNFIIKT